MQMQMQMQMQSMYVCMSVCLSVYLYICICVYVYVYIYIHMLLGYHNMSDFASFFWGVDFRSKKTELCCKTFHHCLDGDLSFNLSWDAHHYWIFLGWSWKLVAQSKLNMKQTWSSRVANVASISSLISTCARINDSWNGTWSKSSQMHPYASTYTGPLAQMHQNARIFPLSHVLPPVTHIFWCNHDDFGSFLLSSFSKVVLPAVPIKGGNFGPQPTGRCALELLLLPPGPVASKLGTKMLNAATSWHF